MKHLMRKINIDQNVSLYPSIRMHVYHRVGVFLSMTSVIFANSQRLRGKEDRFFGDSFCEREMLCVPVHFLSLL